MLIISAQKELLVLSEFLLQEPKETSWHNYRIEFLQDDHSKWLDMFVFCTLQMIL